MLTLLDILMKAHDDGHTSFAVLINFARALDTVFHVLLLRKFRGCGVVGPMLEILGRFPTGQNFVAKVGKAFSQSESITTGVQHGWALGPPHFLVCVNDLYHALLIGSAMCADDVALWSPN